MNLKNPTRFRAPVSRKTVHQNDRRGGMSLFRKQAEEPCNDIQDTSELLSDRNVLE